MATPAPPTIRIKDVDFSKLNFTDKRDARDKNKGTDNVFISYGENKEWPRIQFPQLRHPFDQAENDDGSVVITLSFTKENPKHQIVINKLKEFDELILNKINANSSAWLKKPLQFVPFLKIKEGEVDGEVQDKYFNIKIKLPMARDKDTGDVRMVTDVYDHEMHKVDSNYIIPRCSVDVIARPARIYFQKTGRVGTTWEAKFVRVYHPERRTGPQTLFTKDSDDEGEAADEPVEQNAVSNVVQNNDDDDAEDTPSNVESIEAVQGDDAGQAADDEESDTALDKDDESPAVKPVALKSKARKIAAKKA